MYKRLLHIDYHAENSYFLFGPRGTGKTTWLRAHFQDAIYIDLLDQAVYLELSSQPSRLSTYIDHKKNNWIIIDEVQKIPALLDEVHRQIEHHKRRFILTGSSARSLRKKGVNLLAGRAFGLSMHPLTAIELEDDFNLSHSLRYGQLPKVISTKEPNKFLASYVDNYLREEVLQEGLTRNIQSFHRFLEIASFSHGEQLNLSSIAREIGMDQKVVSNYFNILEDLLIAYRLPAFTRRAKRKLAKHPKFYFFDAGIYQQIRPRGPLDSESEISGPALEGLFLQELRAINAYSDKQYDFYYWRAHTGQEVDIVLYGENGFKAFEIKHRDRFDNNDLKGLKAFHADYPEAECFLVYQGTQEKVIDNIRALPVEMALRSLEKLI
ncbi:MAG: ATPase [Gammaproteobacteria bacterium CG11_big_fil_rev_8_21_14_0_20_46_22]|nr:MAG: ATPase [Gammaproteobacteria bacterium CG12_big_fil_rev_8_21_14_0_65_46_12]PIR11014.1 MAG: ATPase [Gammaproteobacteria bacterium CG11_big_fil_rev_8_21_14_0_20_46_22]